MNRKNNSTTTNKNEKEKKIMTVKEMKALEAKRAKNVELQEAFKTIKAQAKAQIKASYKENEQIRKQLHIACKENVEKYLSTLPKYEIISEFNYSTHGSCGTIMFHGYQCPITFKFDHYGQFIEYNFAAKKPLTWNQWITPEGKEYICKRDITDMCRISRLISSLTEKERDLINKSQFIGLLVYSKTGHILGKPMYRDPDNRIWVVDHELRQETGYQPKLEDSNKYICNQINCIYYTEHYNQRLAVYKKSLEDYEKIKALLK